MEGKWKINGIDISNEFGAYLKKGSYASMLVYPEAKEYVSEDIREENGSRIHIDMPRVKSRQFTLTFYIIGEPSVIHTNYERFFAFLHNSGEFTLTLCEHNRNYRLTYLTGMSRKDVKVMSRGVNYIEADVMVLQRNPHNVTETDVLMTEGNSSVEVLTEEGEEIEIETSIYEY